MGEYFNMGDFKESLCGCFSHLGSCACVTFNPCGAACVQGNAVAMVDVDKGACGPCWLQLFLCCIGATINRSTMRKQLRYDSKCCLDLLTH